MDNDPTYSAFAGNRLIASGTLKTMVLRTKECIDRGEADPLLIFEDQTGAQIDFDWRGTPDEVLLRLSSHPWFASSEVQGQLRIGPGRPKLGVVCKEVSMLPRHWAWLEQQPGGTSATLRKLVDEVRTRGQGKQLARIAREAVGKFMWAIAGNLRNFEEASRALYARDQKRMKALIREWPDDIRTYVERRVEESERLENE